MLLTKVFFILCVVSTCSCWYYYHYYYNPYDKYFRKPYSYFTRENSNCEKWCYSYTTPHIHCCLYKESPNTCPYSTIYCTVPLAPDFTALFQCNGDFDCPVGYKCCDDSCFSHKICKSHNIEWLRWNTYSHAYNQYQSPITAPPSSYSPKETENDSEVLNITITPPITSTIGTETSSEEVTEVSNLYCTSQLENETTAQELGNTDTDETLTTSASPQLENVTTTEAVFNTTVTSSDSSQLENLTTTEDVSDVSVEETSPIFTTASSSTTRSAVGGFFSLFDMKENNESNKTEKLAENSVDVKEAGVISNNETDTSNRPDEEINEIESVVEGSGTEFERKETESTNKEGSGNGDDKKNHNTFIDDEDIERKRRSNFGSTEKNEEGKRKIVLNYIGDDNDTQNNDLIFDNM